MRILDCAASVLLVLGGFEIAGPALITTRKGPYRPIAVTCRLLLNQLQTPPTSALSFDERLEGHRAAVAAMEQMKNNLRCQGLPPVEEYDVYEKETVPGPARVIYLAICAAAVYAATRLALLASRRKQPIAASPSADTPGGSG